MKFLSKLKQELKRKITIAVIPHGKAKPFKLNISVLVGLFFLVSWTGVTIWAGYLSSRHIDYVKVKADNQIMHIRLALFANKLEQTQTMVAGFKSNDAKIRSLLSLDSKKAIIANPMALSYSKNRSVSTTETGAGGPYYSQAIAFSKFLSGRMENLSYDSVSQEARQLNEQYKFMEQSYNEVMSKIRYERAVFDATPMGLPVEAGHVSSNYGYRYHPVYGNRDFHSGIDIGNAKGTPVYATANGVVIFSGWKTGYGNIIVIDHGYNYRTAYAHLDKRIVQEGAYVFRRQEIGAMGKTGTATGYHVHYEVHYKGNFVNPSKYMKEDYS